MSKRKPKPHRRPKTKRFSLTTAPLGTVVLTGDLALAYTAWQMASQLLVAKALAIKPLIAERDAAREELRLAGMGADFEKATERYRLARLAADPPEADFKEQAAVVRDALQRLSNLAAPASVPG